jgi:hypothetical protein
MSETKFTPGPWFGAKYSGNSKWIAATIFEDQSSNGWKDGNYMCVSGPISHADAALIAAAPDLYAALEALCTSGGDDDGTDLISNGLAALAKARGEA